MNSYWLFEMNGALAITTGKNPLGAQPLVTGGREDVVEYLNHYLAAREAGKPQREAHELALEAARIPKGILLT